MAISIDWNTGIISVPKTESILIQSVPSEIREYNLNVFRLAIGELLASETGMPYTNTHTHVSPIDVGGITLARVISLLPPYTVTFEDGQYAMNLVAANSNIGDRVNVNQVSVRSFNSAGLVTSDGIESIEYQNAVWLDENSTATGTIYPVGTPRMPCSNVTDARIIASKRGFSQFNIIGNYTFDTGDNIEGYTVYGQDSTKSFITVNTGSLTAGSVFKNATVTGIFDDAANFELCGLVDISFVQGYIYKCVLGGILTLSGNGQTGIFDCWDGLVGEASTTFPIIDFGGSGQSLIVRNYSGDILLRNKSGIEYVEMDQVSGVVYIDSTVTNGIIKLRGAIDVADNSTGNAYIDTTQVIYPEYLQLVAYGDKIHIDPLDGTDGIKFPQGIEQYPVKTIADAITISERLRIKNFHVDGTTLVIPTLTDISSYAFYGANPIETVMFLSDGCITERTQFYDMIVVGAINGSVFMRNVGLQALTNIGADTFPSVFNECIFRAGTHSFRDNLITPQNVHFINCVGGEFGAAMILDFNNTTTPVVFKGYTGGIKVTNFTSGTSSGFNITQGKIEFDSTCTNGAVNIRGDIDPVIDNSGVGFIITDFVMSIETITFGVWDEILIGSIHNIPNSAGKRLRDLGSQAIHTDNARGAGTNGNQIELAESAADYDGAYDPSKISIIDGTGHGQTRLIYQYEGSTRLATVDRDWKIEPDNTSEYIIFADAGRDSINEGLARGGTEYTITLNDLASDVDNVYRYQSVFIRSGTGQDQVGHVSSYDGTTKIATLGHPWLIIPDSTSGYAILPTHLNPEGMARHVWEYDITEMVSDVMAGKMLKMLKDYNINKMEWDEVNSRFIIFNDAGDTETHYVNVTNRVGSSISMDIQAIASRDGQIDA